MKSFLEWHGYFYSQEEITEFIETDFFKKRMKDFLKELEVKPQKSITSDAGSLRSEKRRRL